MTPQLYIKKGTRYVPTTLAEQGAWGWESLMVLAAFRYCCGRQTYIVGVCVDWLIGKWAHFPEKERLLIRRDLEEEFKRDDEARASGEKFLPLGWDCDRKDWERVRALWSDAPPAAPVQQSPEEIARRARWLVTEMEAVGSAMVRVAQASGFTAPQADSVLEDAARWQEHVGKLDALVAYCPTCCQGFIAQKEMTRDQIIFECGKTAGRAARKQGANHD